jgi:type VI secretion system protein ImpK
MKLIDKFIPVFQVIKNLPQNISDDSDMTLIDFEQQFKTLLSNVKCSGCSKEQNQNALFSVCALVDEIILDSEWKYRNEWAKSPLQKKYFDTHKAGTQFYEILDTLNENDIKDQDVREVFLYSLVQGFSGCYFESGEESVKQEIIQANYALLSKDIKINLFSPQIPIRRSHEINNANRKKQKELLTTFAPIGILLFSYFLLRSNILDSVSQISSQI